MKNCFCLIPFHLLLQTLSNYCFTAQIEALCVMMMKPLPLFVTMGLVFAKLDLQEMMLQEPCFHPLLDALDIRSVGTRMEVLPARICETCGSDKGLFRQISHSWELSLLRTR